MGGITHSAALAKVFSVPSVLCPIMCTCRYLGVLTDNDLSFFSNQLRFDLGKDERPPMVLHDLRDCRLALDISRHLVIIKCAGVWA